MIVAAVSCPHPPLLLPGLDSGAVPELDGTREACARAVETLAELDEVIIVGGADQTAEHPLSDAPTARFAPGATPAQTQCLPLSLAVGVGLMAGDRKLRLHSIAWDAGVEECIALGTEIAAYQGKLGLLVLADGSARRGVKAPGHLDPRARATDERWTSELIDADATAILDEDPTVAADLMIAGRAAWQVLAGVWRQTPMTGELVHGDDPFGVWYPVLRWHS